MRRSDKVFALLIMVVCAVALVGTVAIGQTSAKLIDDPTKALLAARPAGTSSIPPLPTTLAVPTTPVPAPAPRLPTPGRAPRSGTARAPANTAVVQIGTIEIPKIALNHPVFEGNTLTQIDHGPSHWPGTAFPGQAGNAVFAGHRVTHTHPFLHIDSLVAGDIVIFTINGLRSQYHVTSSEVVTPDQLRIIEQTPTPTATLFGCHPPHSAKYRYVVHLALDGF